MSKRLRSRARTARSTSPSTPPRPSRTPAPPNTPGPLGTEVRSSLQRSAILSPPGPSSVRTAPTSPSRHPRRTLFGTPVSPPPQRRQVRPARPLEPMAPSSPQRSRSNSTSAASDRRLREALAQTQEQLTQLTAAVALIAQPVQAQAAPQEPVAGPHEDPDFDWTKLRSTPETAFPPASTGQVQRLAASLLAKLPELSGRDRHEVQFLLNVASDYPDMDDTIQNVVYQRLNLLFIATHHGWATAIAASSAATTSIAVFPPGFQLPNVAVPQRRTFGRRPQRTVGQQQPPQQQQPPPQPQQQQAGQQRGRGRRNRRY